MIVQCDYGGFVDSEASHVRCTWGVKLLGAESEARGFGAGLGARRRWGAAWESWLLGGGCEVAGGRYWGGVAGLSVGTR